MFNAKSFLVATRQAHLVQEKMREEMSRREKAGVVMTVISTPYTETLITTSDIIDRYSFDGRNVYGELSAKIPAIVKGTEKRGFRKTPAADGGTIYLLCGGELSNEEIDDILSIGVDAAQKVPTFQPVL